MASPDLDPRIGMTLGGKYELLRRLGAGGMGVVYEAVNALTGRRVAVKLLLGNAINAHVRQRLLQEARAAARIQHPNVVDVLDVAVDPDAGPFLVMELLDGESLEDRLVRDGALSFGEVASLLRPVAEALQLAHDAGIVHRDIKPSNIFLHTDARGEVTPKLVDFGIARADGPRITRSGVMAGTVGYMAPEQMHDAKRADQRSDIWSLAVVVYECFAG
jgi:serine/threonine-protein kinase